MLAKDKIRSSQIDAIALKYKQDYREAMQCGDQVRAFQAYYALWVIDKKKIQPDP